MMLLLHRQARAILESIHWKPAIRWVVDEISVIKPIKFKDKYVHQKNFMILKDVEYLIKAHF